MFRSAAEISSSDSQSSSDESGYNEVTSSEHDAGGHRRSSGRGKTTYKARLVAGSDHDNGKNLSQHDLPDIKGMLDVDAEGHANMMTAALLEFYCHSRAADVLNSQKGSHGRFTRDSPEVQYLGKRMYACKSQFLSSHGLLAGGVEKEELGKTRQYYRDHLDLLGVAALEKLDLSRLQGRTPPIGITGDLAKTSRTSTGRQLLTDKEYAESTQFGTRNWDLRKRPSKDEGVDAPKGIPLDMGNMLNPMLSPFPSSPVSFPLLNSPLTPPSNLMSRYAVEFCEVKVLGRGSFGEVYHVKNHIDGQDYAVKKIPLSRRRLEQLRSGGQNQLENIMREIRTLARLEHSNIVRYYGAWVEQAEISGSMSPGLPPSFQQRDEQTQENLISQESTDGQSFDIVFENSENATTEAHSSSASVEYNADSFDKSRRPSSRSHQSVKSLGHSLQDDDEDVESIPRNFSTPSHGQLSTIGGTDDDIFTDGLSQDQSMLQVQRRYRQGSQAPAIILHIQMSLHPISLSSYLNPQPSTRPGNDDLPLRRHCFHLIPSLKLMLDIVYGVEYLHSKGIVHRDLKPANIFLSSPEKNELEACPTCKSEHGAGFQYCRPRIGDFGLVADISHLNDGGSNGNATPLDNGPRVGNIVGTEFYRPCINGNDGLQVCHGRTWSGNKQTLYSIDEKLDVYALGVIFFELLYRLNTKMERQLVLAELTRGKNNPSRTGQPSFPADFTEKVDLGMMLLDDGTSVAESLMACIKGMLDPHPQQRWSCQDVKKSLGKLLVASGGHYAP